MRATRPDSAELNALMGALMAGAALQQGEGPTLQEIADQYPELMAQLAKLSPVHAAMAFGGLLTMPELQANCMRLETLVRLALMAGNGTGRPTETFIRSAFKMLGSGHCGHMEDPAEDLFVGTVRTSRGNFRVIEGMWEGNAFYLQRFLDAVEAMPKGSGYDELRDSIHALLVLSDLVCSRARLVRHQIGEEMPADRLSAKLLGMVGGKVHRIRFSEKELRQAGIEPFSLAPFLFMPSDRSALGAEPLGNSRLERQPLIREQGNVALVLPTAVSAAIRAHVLGRMDEAGMLGAIRRGMADEYADHFAQTQLLGGHLGTPIAFQFTKHGAVASVSRVIDAGRYLNLIFFTDHLSDWAETGIAGINPDCTALGNVLGSLVDQTYEAASAQPGFVDGITLIVGCGIGRGSVVLLERQERPGWRTEFISAYDLDTLSWTPDFKPLSLWRLLDAEAEVEAHGIALQNVNGLLNLVAWSRSLGGHLVPHGNMPDDMAGEGGGGMLIINQNSQRELRHQVAVTYDPRVVQTIEGRWIPMRRDEQSDFADDRAAPLYGSEVMNDEGWLMSAYLAPLRDWWAEASMPAKTSGAFGYERWRIVTVWLARAAPILDRLPTLPTGPVKWRAVFEETLGGLRNQGRQLSYEDARSAVRVSVDHNARTVTTIASPAFEDSLHHPENIAERALVDALIEGFLLLAGASQDERPNLLRAIVPGALARQAHALAAQHFRDFVHHRLPRKVVRIDMIDDAAIRLGLGWRVRNRSLGGGLEGKEETTSYLNALVRWVEDDLCEELRGFNRETLLRRLLLNHEAAASDRDRWSRTAAAVLALHSDREASLATIGTHDFALNAVFQASRILMEMAICESSDDSGREPGELDLSRLMTKAALIFHVGGWSDAIRWDVMEPTVRITPLGDVHAKFGYVDTIITPHARETSDVRINDAASSYADRLKQAEANASISDLMEPRFLEAWEEEFGASLQEVRILIDWLENRGIARDEPVMRMTKADFVGIGTEGQAVAPDAAASLLEAMTLVSRPSWRDVPEGFEDRDRQPWRFRRRLSPIRRPILRCGSGDDAVYLVAPGMVRDAFIYMVANYLRGDFPPHQLSRKMRTWAAREADKRGAQFTQEVAAALCRLGWETETEVRVNKLLSRGLDRDYGDVDVLAWHKASNRVLAIECKDVQFKKTIGEICEQLSDFRGGLRPDGKPDLLRRHLDRMEVIEWHRDEVQAYLKLPVPAQVESHLIFKNPVPMKYALQKLVERVAVSIFDEMPAWATLSDATLTKAELERG